MARAVLLALLLVPAARSQDEADRILKAAQARAVRAVREAGPSIVCVCVSRSEAYRTAPHWGVPADAEQPGKLGAFDAEAAERKVPEDAPKRERTLRRIAAHDMSAEGHVPESYGSGFVVDKSGLVLTNAHVVKNATKIFVRISGKAGCWADIHACDPRSDLAVLKLIGPPAGLVPLPMGDGGAVEKGQFILSLSFHYRDAGATVRPGMVTNLRQQIPRPGAEDESARHKLTLHHYGTLIQTDAHATVSGGAILDLDGKAVGLISALAGVSDRSGFAIPLDASTRRIIEVLKRGEEVEYGFLGVVVERGGDLPRGGIRLNRVSPGSPAAKSGLRSGDTIVAVDGNPIRKNDDLFLYVGMVLAGRTAKVEIDRRGAREVLNVALAKFYVPGPVIASKRPPATFGMRVDWSSIHSQRNPFALLGRDLGPGVVVREVVSGGPADKALLQPGKYITHVNGVAVSSPAEYQAEIGKAGRKVELTVLSSEGRPTTVSLEGK